MATTPTRLKTLSEEKDNWWCWILCFLAALCNALHLGVSLSFGVLLPYLLAHFKQSIDITAMVGSLAIAITFGVTFPAAKLVDYFGLRVVTFSGAVICIISLVATSFAKNIIVVFFTYSIGFGCGASFLYTTSMFISNKYFKRHREVAIGIICSGGGSGYLAFGPVMQLCISKFGWVMTCRFMGALFVVPGVIAFLYGSNKQREEDDDNCEPLEEAHPRNSRKKLVDWSFLKNSSYTVNVASMSLAGLAHYVPQIFVVELCEKLGISSSKSSQLLIFIGLSSLVSRVTAGVLQNYRHVSTVFVFQSSQFLDAVVQFAIPFAYKFEHFIAISILYGLVDGAFSTSLNNILLTSVHPEQLSSSFGFGCFASSLSIAAGAPLAGLLIKHFNSHNPAFFAAAGILLVSTLIPSVRSLVLLVTSRVKKSTTKSEVRIELYKEHKPIDEDPEQQNIANKECKVSPFQVLVCVSSENIDTEIGVVI